MTPMGMSEDFTESNLLSANSDNFFLHIPSYLKSFEEVRKASAKTARASAHRTKPDAASAPGQKRLALFAADQAQLSSVQVSVARGLAAP